MTDRLFSELERFGERTAVLTPDGPPISYARLVDDADKIGGLIEGRPLAIVVCRNCPGTLAAYIGLLRAGAAVFLVHHAMGRAHLDDLIEAFRPAYVAAPAADTHAGKRSEIPHGFALFETGHEIDYRLHDDLALLLTTSGSTGSRSLVRLTEANLRHNAEAIAAYLAITAEDRPITTMPMSYSFGLSIVNSHLIRGASIILSDDSLVSPGFWDALRAHEATTFGGVPYIFDILKKLRFGRMDLPSLKYITQAGGNLGAGLTGTFLEICAGKGIDLVVMYGQTEASPRISYVPPDRLRDKLGSIGVAIPGGEMWLEDDDGNVITKSRVPGELVYRGGNVSLGYAENRFELDKPDENRGILRTGDIAERDDDGYFFIKGRKKRFLKVFGHRVNLDEVEHILGREGHACACAGVDGRLSLVFEADVDGKAVKKLVFEKTGINQSALKVHHVAEIPRNPSGKVLYPALNDMIANGGDDA